MPKETFLNLPEEKRERILEAAVNEFHKHNYYKASITRIVAQADIAKGSFYQYFEDKGDLFKYILDRGAEEKLQYLHHVMTGLSEMDFFQITRELYVGGVKFAKAYPKLSEIANNFMKDGDSQLKAKILGDNIPKSNQLFERLLMQGIQKGEIDSNIDVALVAFIFTSLSVSLGEYFIKNVEAEDDMEIMKLVDKMLYIFERGIRKK